MHGSISKITTKGKEKKQFITFKLVKKHGMIKRIPR